jgi:ribosome-associated toxin RatA of RatAB toxin-antitoxin module
MARLTPDSFHSDFQKILFSLSTSETLTMNPIKSIQRKSTQKQALFSLSLITSLLAGLIVLHQPAAVAGHNANELTTLNKGGVVVKEANVIDKSKDGPATVSAQILIPKPPSQVWPIVANPQDVMSQEKKVKKVQTLKQAGNSLDVAYTVNYSSLLPTFNYTLRLDKKQPSTITFKRLNGSFKDINGSWQLTPVDNGQKTILTYTLSIDPGFFAPKFLLVQAIKNDLPTMMKNVKAVVDKKALAAN